MCDVYVFVHIIMCVHTTYICIGVCTCIMYEYAVMYSMTVYVCMYVSTYECDYNNHVHVYKIIFIGVTPKLIIITIIMKLLLRKF